MSPEELCEDLFFDLLKLRQLEYPEDELHNLLWKVYDKGFAEGFWEGTEEDFTDEYGL